MQEKSKKNTGEEAERRFKFRYLAAFVISVLFMLSIISYSPDDFEAGRLISNYIGEIGAAVSLVTFRAAGLSSYVLVAFVMLWGVRHLLWQIPWERKLYWTGIVLAVLGTAILFAINPMPFVNVTDALGLGHRGAPAQAIPGGMLGQFLAAPGAETIPPVSTGILRKYIGYVGTSIVGYLLLFGGVIIVYLSDWHKVVVALVKKTAEEKVPAAPKNSAIRDALLAMKERHEANQELKAEQKREAQAKREAERLQAEDEAKKREEEERAAAIQTALIPDEQIDVPAAKHDNVSEDENSTPATIHTADPEVNISVKGEKGSKSVFNTEYARPNLNMLSKGDDSSTEDIGDIERKKAVLQETLDSFKVDGHVGNHITGPRVTRYEITLAPGVKVDKVSGLADNIKMNLEATSIRLLAPIPRKKAVGVEAPNKKSAAVHARSIMESAEWVNSDAEMPIVLGKDVAGKPIMLDLAKAPHLLIAGQTGSGKSVCMNTLIMSLLFKFSPDDLRMIMVDPKVVELKDYEKIPHLITPVLNDSQKVPMALRWAVNEMERRYRLMADAGVKSMKAFNKRPHYQGEVDRNGEPMPDKLPLLVIIIDELADLMLTEAKVEVETSINRIAAKARAAGMHIVVATQRPSTNVITGVIKANLPTRIAFKVGSGIDSRVILDRNGAEKLLGKGDMLFLPPGGSELERVQGAMVQDDDIKKIVSFISAQRPQEFNESVLVDEDAEAEEDDMVPSSKRGGESRTELDNMMDDILSQEYAPLVQKYSQPGDDKRTLQALEIILSSRQASTSYLQRRMKIGYNTAADLIDLFEARGIIGPQSAGGNKRQILVFDEIDGV